MKTLTFYTEAHREEGFWVVEVPHVGTTQGRTRWGARFMARDLISARLGIPRRSVRVRVDWK